MAVFLSLKRINPKERSHVRLMVDNTTVVHCINRHGSKSPRINHVILAILHLAKRRQWHLSAAHVQGVMNVVADSLSRDKAIESEWEIDNKTFSLIQKHVPNLQIDLFATEFNRKLQTYIAPTIDPKSAGMDALAMDWNQWSAIYLFPPFNLMMKVLAKLRSFKGTAALVAPLWPQSKWYPLVVELNPKIIHLPAPSLSQIVQGETVFASSLKTEKLRLMIFSRLP